MRGLFWEAGDFDDRARMMLWADTKEKMAATCQSYNLYRAITVVQMYRDDLDFVFKGYEFVIPQEFL